MISEELLQEVWETTKPRRRSFAQEYLNKLRIVFDTPKALRFWVPFDRVKKSGGTRRIVPAGEDLAFVHYVLSEWLARISPPSKDYCYTGRGVLGCVSEHIGSKCALVVDLKSAFDRVTYDRLKFALKTRQSNMSDAALDVICDLMTYPVYNGKLTTPQGCVSTPYAYNLLMLQIDKTLEVVASSFPDLKVTRYSDNICFSSPKPVDLDKLGKRAKAVITANGFDLSWTLKFSEPPFRYLGTRIYTDKILLDEEKYGEYCDLLLDALVSYTPNAYRKQVTGMFVWAKNICGNNIPADMLELFVRYFEKVKAPPESLTKMNEGRNPRLF